MLFENDRYDDSMTDAEFFKLMGAEYAGNYTDSETDKDLPQRKQQISKNRTLKTSLSIAIVIILVASMLV